MAVHSTLDQGGSKEVRAQRALVLSNLSRLLLERGESLEARQYLMESLAMVEDRFNLANILASLGEVETRENNFPSAYQYFERALLILEELGYKSNFALLWTLASLAKHRGEAEDACYLLAAAEASRQISNLTLSPLVNARYQSDIADVAAKTPPGRYAQIWEEGKAATLQHVIALCRRKCA